MQDDNKKPTVEDQELADMIAKMNSGAPTTTSPPPPSAPANPLVPAPKPATPPPPPPPADPPKPPLPPKPPAPPAPAPPPPPPALTTPPLPPLAPAPKPPTPPAPSQPTTDLSIIKQSAMDELRPLVDRLDLPADEKFDTLLLLIRSTDDKALIKPAHESAQNITDDKKRAQALLDIVKEIDFFENANK